MFLKILEMFERNETTYDFDSTLRHVTWIESKNQESSVHDPRAAG